MFTVAGGASQSVPGASTGAKRRLVMLAGALPQRLAPSAGTEYVTTLAEELSRSFDVTAIAPGHEANRSAIRDGRHVLPSLLVGATRAGFGERLLGLADRTARKLDLALPPLYFAMTLVVNREARVAIQEADVIDLQWAEFVALAPLVRALNRDAVVIGTMHDSMTQVAERSAQGPFYRLRRAITARHEGQLPGAVAALQVLNQKDAQLIAALPGVRSMPHVIHPPRPQPRLVRSEAAPPEVLFVGAFGRAVNREAMAWFLSDVWPAVLQCQPDAQLVLAGSDPQGSAAEAAAGRAEVTATGFVEDLGKYYSRAAVVAVPLRNGAGVKFKTIDALLHAVPVVSTTVGVEGIDGDDLFWAVTDSAPEFAAAVVEALGSPAARLRAEGAARQVGARYSREAFARSVERIYGGLA